MKTVLSFFIASCLLCVSSVQAGLNITDSQHQVYAKFSGDSASGDFSDNAATPLNGGPVTSQNGGTLGFQGTKGNYEYDYTTNNMATIVGNTTKLDIFASVDFSALSESATVAHGEEGVGSFIDFKITGQNYVGVLNFTSNLSPTNSGTSSLNTFSFLLRDGVRVNTLSHSIDSTGTEKTFSDLPLPIQLLLTPGDYRLYVGLNGLRDGTYSLPNLSMSGTASLSISAVPEPATLILWSCIGAVGAPKLRSYLKRRNGIKV